MRLFIPSSTLGVVVGLLVLGAAGVAGLVYLPRAEIVITPSRSEEEAAQPIYLSTQATEPDFVAFRLPAKLLELTATHEQTFERPGSVAVDEFARGEVRLINRRDEVQELLPKTHLKYETSGVFFLTDFPVAIPARGEVRMTVTAKEKGRAGNVAAGRFNIDKLPVELQSDVYAQSLVAFTGGVAVEEPLSEEEITKAQAAVLAQAQEKARSQFSVQAVGTPVRAELTSISPTQELVSAQAGSKPQTFTVATTVQARAFLVDQNDLFSLTLLGLRATPHPDKEFVSYSPESFAVEIEQADFERGEARLIGKMRGVFASKIGPTALDPVPLAGLSSEEVKAYFKDNSAVGEVSVKLSPFWVRSVPGRRGAVRIQVAS